MCLPVEAPGKIGQRHFIGPAGGIARVDGKNGLRGKPLGHAVEGQAFGHARTAHRLVPRRGLQYDTAIGAGANNRAFSGFPAGRGVGPRHPHTIAQRAVDQRSGAEQVGIAVLLDRPARQAGNNGTDRHHPLCHAFKANGRFASGQRDRAPFADHRETARPIAFERFTVAAFRVTIDRDRDLARRAGIDCLACVGSRADQREGQGKAGQPAHRPAQ